MRPIKIFTDSCADLSRYIREKYHISYFRLNFMKEGIEKEADLDWKSIAPQELYDGLRDGDYYFTLPVTELNFYKKMSSYVNNGYDIIYIACPEVLSKTIVKGRRVAQKVMKENPDARIEVIDSLNASMGQGLLTIQAGQMVMDGKEMDEIVETVKGLRKRVTQFASVETLTYLSRANRITSASAILGNILQLKPILTADINGRQAAYCNIRGREASLCKVADLFVENIENAETQDIYIMHADCMDGALHMKELLQERGLQPKSFKIGDFGLIVGIATGPGTICVFGFGKEVTFEDKVKQKK